MWRNWSGDTVAGGEFKCIDLIHLKHRTQGNEIEKENNNQDCLSLHPEMRKFVVINLSGEALQRIGLVRIFINTFQALSNDLRWKLYFSVIKIQKEVWIYILTTKN